MAEELGEKSAMARMADGEGAGGDDDDGVEEGEIVNESEEGSSSTAIPKGLVTKHPLEHSWTFWFDNPSAKSKQAAWGSSIRPIYTFSTVEDFWR